MGWGEKGCPKAAVPVEVGVRPVRAKVVTIALAIAVVVLLVLVFSLAAYANSLRKEIDAIVEVVVNDQVREQAKCNVALRSCRDLSNKHAANVRRCSRLLEEEMSRANSYRRRLEGCR